MKGITKTLVCIFITMALWVTGAYALDPPHNQNINYQCDDCHFVYGDSKAWYNNGYNDPTTDDTPLNRLCNTCHDGITAPQMKTHSAYAMQDYSYGTWNYQCIDCHNPHYQRQIRRYGNTSYLYTGTSTSIQVDQPQAGQSQLTEAGAGWTRDQWKDMVLIPDTSQWWNMFRIKGNTADTITVDGSISATAGSTFAIAYGKLIKDVVNSKTVRFITNFDTVANKSGFIQDDYTGICQVCHTQTNHWQNDGTEPQPNHNQDNASQMCTDCHSHPDGLKPTGGCTNCHGGSGSTGAPLVYNDLVGVQDPSYPTTGHTEGAHNTHVETQGFTNCDICHNNNGMPSVDQKITIAFSGYATANGSTPVYDGTALSNGYTYQGDVTGPSTATQDCSNVYCHSNVQGANGTGSPTSYGTPDWANASSVQCGSCHKADGSQGDASLMDSGSHTKHVDPSTYNKACSTCHSGAGSGTTSHANATIDVSIDTTYGGSYNGSTSSPGDHSPGQGYGTCSNVYCHSDGQSTLSYANRTWGTGTADCVFCHGGAGGSTGGAGTALTSSHSVHTDTSGFAYTCNYCHTTTASNNTTITDYTRHVNKAKNVAVDSSVGGTGTDGGNYSSGTCSNINCHGSASPDWSTGGTTGDCSLCHGMAASASDGRDTNGDTANTDPQVGAHVAHLNNTHGYRSSGIACSECHTVPSGATYVDKVKAAGHIDSSLPAEVPLNGTLATTNGATPSYSGSPGGTCANTYCHDGRNFKNGWSTAAQIEFETPDWNTPIMDGTVNDCDNCHGYPPGGGHTTQTTCHNCHTHVNSTDDGFTDASLHIDGQVIAQQGGSCDSCHGYPPATGAHQVHYDNIRQSYNPSGWNTDPTQTSWDGTTHNVCGTCHDMSNTANHMDTADHISPAGEAFDAGAAPAYEADFTCSNIRCHFGTSPAWK